MARRQDLKSILILGSGPSVIGQAREFDYSGVQSCTALHGDGYRIILINSDMGVIAAAAAAASTTTTRSSSA